MLNPKFTGLVLHPSLSEIFPTQTPELCFGFLHVHVGFYVSVLSRFKSRKEV